MPWRLPLVGAKSRRVLCALAISIVAVTSAGATMRYGDIQISGNVSAQSLFRIQGGAQTFTAFDPVQQRNTLRLQYEQQLAKHGSLLNGILRLPYVDRVDLLAYYR